jgi:preprotein translocase subunit SecE
MTEQVQENPQSGSAIKLLLAAVIMIAGFVGFYYLDQQPIWVRWLLVLAALVGGAWVASQSALGKDVWQFIQGARIELRKVVWPTKKDSRNITLVVFVAVAILGLFFAGLDWILASLTKWLTSRGA